MPASRTGRNVGASIVEPMDLGEKAVGQSHSIHRKYPVACVAEDEALLSEKLPPLGDEKKSRLLPSLHASCFSSYVCGCVKPPFSWESEVRPTLLTLPKAPRLPTLKRKQTSKKK